MFGILGFNAAMGKRQKQVASRPRSSRRENSEEIPVDLWIDIFSRLQMKDVARCRCVSKFWSSILRRRDFTQLFFKMSSFRPCLLFTFQCKGRRMFYSLPQDLDPNRDYSSPLSLSRHMHFPKGLGFSGDMCPPIRGFICSKSKKPMICNPSTGEHISLPLLRTKKNQMRPYFGYDPIDKLFKVLGVSDDYVFRVATVGPGEVTWRSVECSIPHQPLHNEICIDGVLYYSAKCLGDRRTPNRYMVVCFDVRLERFKFLSVGQLQFSSLAFIDYKGKLGILFADSGIIDEDTTKFKLIVLEDANEEEWSKTVYKLPYYWKRLKLVGMTSAGEILLSSFYKPWDPFYIFYYNTVKKTVVRIEIELFDIVASCFQCSDMWLFTNHVENVEMME